MPILFWLPAIIISEVWSMVWIQMLPRPIRVPKD